MSQAEFAKFRSETPAASAPSLRPAAAHPAPQRQAEPLRGLRVLLFDPAPASAARVREMLHSVFGGDAPADWVSDAAEAAELMRRGEHDLYLCADGGRPAVALPLVRAAIEAEAAPVIMLCGVDDPDAGLPAIEAGASDSIPLRDLTAAGLERAVRHALIRRKRLAEARREIQGLTAEKSRLNLLRDANHRFVENACHDFRSPLTVIKEFAAIIAEGLAGEVNEEQAEFLEIILTRVDQLSQMVDGILDASRLESDLICVRREEHAVEALIEKVRPTLEQRAAASKVTIDFAIPESLPKVFADAESIGRIIANLGGNAVKYAGEAGRIRVWARYNPDSRNVTIGVTDSGAGIAPEHVKLIFDRFHQVPGDKQEEKGGFGLGLHIASEFVRVNFGTLTVESEPKKGSTFAFTLPIFDIDTLIPLHFDFVRTSRHSFQNIAIALAATAPEADADRLPDVERLLNRQLRPYDLLLRVRPGTWLVGVACDETDTAATGARILATYSDANRSRSGMPLPDIRLRPVGTLALASRPEALRAAISGIRALGGQQGH